MLLKPFFYFFIFTISLVSCADQTPELNSTRIIPQPDRVVEKEGYFVLNDDTGIQYDDNFKVAANFLRNYIASGSSFKLKNNNAIVFEKDTTLSNVEAYTLSIDKKQIKISAATDQGAFYAVQSLRQLLPVAFEAKNYKADEVKIQNVNISDQPQFKYRGMHLDVGRHMYSVAFIKSYIDALAMLKMNTFHWHLTEDQGWRIEIKKYPKLQEVAAYRDETLIGHYSDQPHQFDGKRYGGYYTQEEIKAIVAYAQERFITIIPEIEMPGHSQAAIAAYPELGCTGKQVEVAKLWGVFEEIYCPKEDTFEFLEDVLDEVLELFPSPYIHIGGDEAPKIRWEQCEDCQRLIKEKGLKDEHELQSYFITRIEKYLNSKGRQIIGWDEILEGGLAPNATVMSWRGTKGAIEAAKSSHHVVMTPTSHCYFDYYQSDKTDEPLAIGGFLPLEKVYGFNPIPEALTEEESKFVLGAQGNVWTEYMPTADAVEYMVFPRILAMSEVVWTAPERKHYEDFLLRLESFHQRLKALDINYANHLYDIEGELIKDDGELKYQLSTPIKDKVIRLTLNGGRPDFESRTYQKPITIDTSRTIRAAVFEFNSKEQLGRAFEQKINVHKAFGKKITINKKPHKAYSGSGAEGLVNGISGSDTRYGDKEWLGFWGEDIAIVINFEVPTVINEITTRFYNANGQWIYAPKSIAVMYHTEDETPTLLKPIEPTGLLTDVSIKKQLEVTKVILTVHNYGTIPLGRQGAGQKAWTFIDEIIIN